MKNLELEEIVSSPYPVLLAAETLRALTMVPGYGFSKTAILCYLWLIRELYTAERFDWSMGGMRAAQNGQVTAFITGKCVYAVQSFATAQRKTGQFIAAAGEFRERVKQLRTLRERYFQPSTKDANILDPWINEERVRLEMSALIKLRQLHRNIVLEVKPPSVGIYEITQKDGKSKFEKYVAKFLGSSKQSLEQELKDTIDNFKAAKKEMVNYRNEKSQKLEPVDFARTQYGYNSAYSAANDAIKTLQAGLKSLEENDWESIKQGFYDSADEVDNIFYPTRNFLSAILDRELAVAHGKGMDSQPAELAFAATSYGRLTENWKKDERLIRAAIHLTKTISFPGVFPNQRPFHQITKGPYANHGNAVVIHAFCQLLRHVKDEHNLPIESTLISKILAFFEHTRANDYEKCRPLFRENEIKISFVDEFLRRETSETEKTPAQLLKRVFNKELKAQLDKLNDWVSLDELEKERQNIIPKMTEELNRLLGEDLIGEGKCLADLKPERKHVKKLWEKEPKDRDERRLRQRVLLEDHFPRDIEKIKPPPFIEKSEPGWCFEHAQRTRETDLWATAGAVLALAKVNEMLDERINHQIMEHFSVKRTDTQHGSKINLEKLFYPDFGLCQTPDPESSEGESEQKQHKLQESIAITLQKMRAHVTRAAVASTEFGDPTFSLILHGPAGTGKTTLVEALAASCGIPMIEITPSDLVRQGEQQIEQRARTVFEALSLLTRVVILFDEFDPVLKRRDPNDKTKPSIFSFLTPGMLPKLKSLHDSAKNRRAAYVLITNLIGTLDLAAIRSGRFDRKVGIYPPDLISRLGRFLSELEIFLMDSEKHKDLYKDPHKDPELYKRLVHIVKKTGGKGMTTLGSPGWFTHPDKDKVLKREDCTPFACILCGGNPDDLERPEPEDKLPNTPHSKAPAAETEFLQWQWVNDIDKDLENLEPTTCANYDYESELIKILRKAVDKPITSKPSPNGSKYDPFD